MPTRFYLNNATPLFIPATTKGAWNRVNTLARCMGTTKFGGLNIYNAEGEDVTTSPYSVLVLRGISTALKTQTITGSVDVILSTYTFFGSAAQLYWHAHIWVTQGNTDVVRGTLLNNYMENTTNEWNTEKALAFQAPASLGSVNAISGDRLVVELGYVARNTVATFRDGRIYYGTQFEPIYEDAPDATVGQNGVALTTSGSINFTQTIQFELVKEELVHLVSHATEDLTPVSAQLAHVNAQVVEDNLAPSQISHLVMQVVEGAPPPLPEISGVYYVNPSKTQWHDSYYNMSEKTISPVIRTALFGE